ncbi:NfeD family protein [Janibacter limosus]|jgi:membrane protein implicated in regulation of membrane protease activity|uniref:NfeD family protein n=1 Tax=Janibacter limosus TaxID=53458 RepID=UPI000829EA26|nr:NfeD family protein [Janibacter limosus]
MEWIGDNLWLAWLVLALILIAIEAATVDFVFVMLFGGALVGAAAAAVGAPVMLQVIAAVVVALLLIGVVRPIIKRQFTNPEDSADIGSGALTGRMARVLETVTETDGRVRLAGETWSARVPDGAPECEPGAEVRVLSIDGATAVVTQQI